ncbi:gluconokinase [Pseudonocardia abyssalis]|uniref:AAA family ATPase n=1 Tax=Pseudonocardia abyssalis TaxID=2792008 RepID=A0ABS6USC3_9PSEU|nr:AAA family ATPase [Pseudonocardia abyssalis]MBW0113871.1 AAA family ATPase [Pseudonocardia abyssalis]MBW0135132.1 AAA family ATPase [Pseudonocardia abyssalis]
MTTLVVMGVSGVGKTVVAAELVARTGCEAADGDDFRSAAGRAPDVDRRPWLHRVADWIGAQEAAGRSTVLTCPPLGRADRDLLRDANPSVRFVHLLAPPAVILERITGRTASSPRPDSGTDARQYLEPDEPGCVVDTTTGSPAAVAELVLYALAQGDR